MNEEGMNESIPSEEPVRAEGRSEPTLRNPQTRLRAAEVEEYPFGQCHHLGWNDFRPRRDK